MPDPQQDGRHSVGNAPGTKGQQQRGHTDADPNDNKTAKNTVHRGQHRKGE